MCLPGGGSKLLNKECIGMLKPSYQLVFSRVWPPNKNINKSVFPPLRFPGGPPGYPLTTLAAPWLPIGLPGKKLHGPEHRWLCLRFSSRLQCQVCGSAAAGAWSIHTKLFGRKFVCHSMMFRKKRSSEEGSKGRTYFGILLLVLVASKA